MQPIITDESLPNKLRWPLLAPSDRVLVAVSGGPDSLSLLHVLWTEREARQLGSVEAAHLDHGLRGDESAGEADWVTAWCRERGITCHVGKADVAVRAREQHLSTQEAAREARYAFLEATAEAISADKIATGHTQDDQVETALANILRGTGLAGLAGIPVRRGRVVRPLLDVSRAEVEAYCAAHGLSPRRDPSNQSTGHYTRNRIRLELLPLLRRDYNAAIDDALLRLSVIAARDSSYLAAQAAAALSEATLVSKETRLVLSAPRLRALHPALLRYVLRQALEKVRGTAAGAAYSHIERLCEVVAGMTPGSGGVQIDGLLPSPGCRVSVFPATLTLETASEMPKAGEVAAMPLMVPGKVVLQSGWVVRAGWEDNPGAARLDEGSVDWQSLRVRTLRAGDRIDPLGMGGRHKKVAAILGDAKAPRAERIRIPIVADARGIVWVAGYALSERVKVTPRTARLLFLSAQSTDSEDMSGGIRVPSVE